MFTFALGLLRTCHIYSDHIPYSCLRPDSSSIPDLKQSFPENYSRQRSLIRCPTEGLGAIRPAGTLPQQNEELQNPLKMLFNHMGVSDVEENHSCKCLNTFAAGFTHNTFLIFPALTAS
ncbi:hypothetical protein DPEC_G00331870 [Dallia pectoralis]|uniref:Uncharacterized protein n=1 Tax=Dallia pectoralis TaxID=75939 RepID=A0ACC2F5Y1_DALPE|nr:hypothetical protein DPEC_G00331870 [Dallia pectoralis]